LGAVAAQMLDGDGVPPRDFFDGDPESACETLTLQWAGEVVASNDRLYKFDVEAGRSGEFVDTHSGCFDVVGDGFHGGSELR